MFLGAGIKWVPFHLITRPARDPDSEGSTLSFRGGILRVFQAFSLVCLFLYLPDGWFEEGKSLLSLGAVLASRCPGAGAQSMAGGARPLPRSQWGLRAPGGAFGGVAASWGLTDAPNRKWCCSNQLTDQLKGKHVSEQTLCCRKEAKHL